MSQLHLPRRHIARSAREEAIHAAVCGKGGLLRFARNDRGSGQADGKRIQPHFHKKKRDPNDSDRAFGWSDAA
jgi:hypothetical protein